MYICLGELGGNILSNCIKDWGNHVFILIHVLMFIPVEICQSL